MYENNEDLTRLLIRENGKGLVGSCRGVDNAASLVQWFAREVILSYGDFIHPGKLSNRTVTLRFTPHITPYNFPTAMVTRKVGPTIQQGQRAQRLPSILL